MSIVTSPHEIVAAEVRAELARRRISQAQVAGILGMTQVSMSRRLRGEVPFDINELLAISRFLGLPLSNFLPAGAA